MTTEIQDTIMIQCAQCCKKHLSAAIAYYAEAVREAPPMSWEDIEAHICLGRAFINMVEVNEGYTSHMDLARGFLVMAEDSAAHNPALQREIRYFRLAKCDGSFPCVQFPFKLTNAMMYAAHMREAEREYPAIRDAVDAAQFRGGKSVQEMNQSEILRIRAMIKWLDENVFLNEEGKGEEKMAKTAKAAKAAAKGGKAAKACGKAAKACGKGGCAKKGK